MSVVENKDRILWATRSAPHLVYAVLPKCACSSIGQILHLLDHGEFFMDGLVHSPDAPVVKNITAAGQAEIATMLEVGETTGFTFVRNPYRRLLSAFADKIFGFQANGRRYRRGELHAALESYGLQWGPSAKIVENLQAFVRFVGDSIETGQPIVADPHYVSMIEHLRARSELMPQWKLHFVGRIESLRDDLAVLFETGGRPFDVASLVIPRENATSVPPLPMSTYFGAEERRIVERVFAEDFELFGYSDDPNAPSPANPIDWGAVDRAMRAGSLAGAAPRT